MLLEIDEQIAQNTPTFFDYEVKVDKLTQENLGLKMRLKEMENEMLKAKIESLETQLKGNSVFFEERQKEWDEMMGAMKTLSTSYETALQKIGGFTRLQEQVDHIRKTHNNIKISSLIQPIDTREFTLNFSEPIVRLCEKLESGRKNNQTVSITSNGCHRNEQNKLNCSEIKIKGLFSTISGARQYICSILNIVVCFTGSQYGISIPVTSDTKKLMKYLGIFEEGCISSTFEEYGPDVQGYYQRIEKALIPFVKLQHGY
jgi:hypothetical protein